MSNTEITSSVTEQMHTRFEAVKSYDGTGRWYVVDNSIPWEALTPDGKVACRKSGKTSYTRAANIAAKLNAAA